MHCSLHELHSPGLCPLLTRVSCLQGVANPQVAPLRLSSISSQDSGFTSQDTLFLRPGSPGSSRANPPDGSDGDLSGSGGSTPGAGWTGHMVQVIDFFSFL